MNLVLPPDDPCRSWLASRGVSCSDGSSGTDPLRVGVLNIMPQAELYERRVLLCLSCSTVDVEPVWLRLEGHPYRSSDKSRILSHYRLFGEVMAQDALDGLVVTGAAVDHLPFEAVWYWGELSEILDEASRSIPSTLGMCWGGMALAGFLGLPKRTFEKKVFGVFETHLVGGGETLLSKWDRRFLCPQSRFGGFDDRDLESWSRAGALNLVAYSREGGYVIFESVGRRFVMHLGHPEYDAERLVFEARRDSESGRNGASPPRNFDVSRPENRWRRHRGQFFQHWLEGVRERRESGAPPGRRARNEA